MRLVCAALLSSRGTLRRIGPPAGDCCGAARLTRYNRRCRLPRHGGRRPAIHDLPGHTPHSRGWRAFARHDVGGRVAAPVSSKAGRRTGRWSTNKKQGPPPPLEGGGWGEGSAPHGTPPPNPLPQGEGEHPSRDGRAVSFRAGRPPGGDQLAMTTGTGCFIEGMPYGRVRASQPASSRCRSAAKFSDSTAAASIRSARKCR